MNLDHTTDLLVVGTGAAGLTAALRARADGLDVTVIEKSDKIGGTSALSGGGLWIPDNVVARAAGVRDSIEDAATYLDHVVDDGPWSTPARRRAYLATGPRMVRFLIDRGARFIYADGYPDYYAEQPGGHPRGRSIEPAVFNGKDLGTWRSALRSYGGPPIALHNHEVRQLVLAGRSTTGARTAARALGVRTLGRMIAGQIPLTMGASLVGQLLLLVRRAGISPLTETPMIELDTTPTGVVTGAVVERQGRRTHIHARRGVLLCAGGFARNPAMRDLYQEQPITAGWSSASPDDTGDGVRAGMAIGAATALLDEAWWGPSTILPNGSAHFLVWERSLPGSIIVDSSGQRFMNESGPYVDCGHQQYQRHRNLPAIPAWMIFDARHRRRYPIGMLPPGFTPGWAIQSGFLRRSGDLSDLAHQCDIDPDGLCASVERINAFARDGNDRDFHRGAHIYDRYYSDDRIKPNPTLGPIVEPPFYALAIYPGDLGTKGGLLTDEHARVLNQQHHPIPGLFAAGNTSASVMGRTYPGPGATLGPALAFAYIAAGHAATHPVTT